MALIDLISPPIACELNDITHRPKNALSVDESKLLHSQSYTSDYYCCDVRRDKCAYLFCTDDKLYCKYSK